MARYQPKPPPKWPHSLLTCRRQLRRALDEAPANGSLVCRLAPGSYALGGEDANSTDSYAQEAVRTLIEVNQNDLKDLGIATEIAKGSS